jgi:glycogen operon protein
MLLCGDEAGHSKKGNNNTYCQDNELSWINWEKADHGLMDLTSKLIHFRREHPVFSRKHWFIGRPIRARGLTDIAWFLPDGIEMEEEHWKTGFAKSLGIFLNGKGISSVNHRNEPIVDDSFYIIFNAHFEALDFKLPEKKFGKCWKKIWDTADPAACTASKENAASDCQPAGSSVKVADRSVVVLVSPRS